jgi:hypothetical protein
LSLLESEVGAERVQVEQPAIREALGQLGGMPIPIAVLSRQMRQHPDLDVGTVLRELVLAEQDQAAQRLPTGCCARTGRCRRGTAPCSGGWSCCSTLRSRWGWAPRWSTPHRTRRARAWSGWPPRKVTRTGRRRWGLDGTADPDHPWSGDLRDFLASGPPIATASERLL